MAGAEFFPRDRVTIVGILNLTPDSFSDGGRFLRGEAQLDVEGAVAEALRLFDAGAHVVDIGGESTRPGALEVPVEVEIARTVPVIEALRRRTSAPLSIDTRKAAVVRAATAAGAQIVNDVSGLCFDFELGAAAAEAGAALILGHMRGGPASMQENPTYEDVLAEVIAELAGSVARALKAGVPREHLVVDPGLGFGKRLTDNLALLARIGELARALDQPVLVGPSRKSFLGALTGESVGERDSATQAACAVAVFAGANALRVHAVGPAVRAAAVARALRAARWEDAA